MQSFFRNELDSIRSALWFRPTAFCLFAVAGALAVAIGDEYLPSKLLSWLPEIDKETLKELLRLLAGSMLTVATVMLSVLMLVLTLVSGQASPRAVPELLADKVTQNALGTFLASFVFSLASLLLLGLNTIGQTGVTLTFFAALILVASSVRYLVQWIHHVADTMKLNHIIHHVHRQADIVLSTYLDDGPSSSKQETWDEIGKCIEVRINTSGYVQLVDEKALINVAACEDLRVQLLVREGHFVHQHVPLMKLAWPASRTDDDKESVLSRLRSCIVVGSERSSENDPLLGFELLAEIACRSLSPGINDPRTALACIDYVGALLSSAATVPEHQYPNDVSENQDVKFVRPGFEGFLKSAVRPVVRDGAAIYEVIEALICVLKQVSLVADKGYTDALTEEISRAVNFSLLRLELNQDKEALKQAAGVS